MMLGFFTGRLGAAAALLCAASPLAMAQTVAAQDAGDATWLDPLRIETGATRGPASHDFTPWEQAVPPALDGGGRLTATPGVEAGRMGGHALDIVIRGQQGNQINVIDAGAFTYGACPNRMDPPSSTASFARAERVIVERGYASVRNGPGATGGTVRLEREAPVFEDGKRWQAEANAGVGSNGAGWQTGARGAVDLGGGMYAELSAELKDADDYEDGSGRKVRSAYSQKSYGATLGYAGPRVDLAFDVDHDKLEDVLFAGAGMDSPLVDTRVWRLRGGVTLDLGPLKRVEGVVYRSEVEHVMDNFSLRPAGMMGMLSPTSSDTSGGKLEAEFGFGATTLWLGVDHQTNTRDAVGFMGMIPVITQQNIADATTLSWPDVSIAQTGLFAQSLTELSPDTRLHLGARYDHVTAKAAAANGVPGFTAATPNQFYGMVYGNDFNAPRDEDNVGGLARIEHDVAPWATLYAGISRAVRTGDANERAMARGMMGMPSWVGDPDVAPEKHHQLDLGALMQGADWAAEVSVWYDRVEDYILLDQFSRPGVTTYRNVDADLAGLELGGRKAWGGLEVSGDLAFTWGENRSDDRALAQIPPLNGTLEASYGQDAWRAGGRLNWSLKQTRIDPARDPGETGAWATVDLFGSYAVTETAELRAGVTNLLDAAYANHLSRANVFDAGLTQVNEPGRSFYVSVSARF